MTALSGGRVSVAGRDPDDSAAPLPAALQTRPPAAPSAAPSLKIPPGEPQAEARGTARAAPALQKEAAAAKVSGRVQPVPWLNGTESQAARTAHKQQGAFLKALLQQLVNGERHQLCESLVKAEREGKCIHRAMFLMVVLLLSSLAGLAYCALLLPDVFRSPSNLLIRSLLVLGLSSLISQVIFLGYLVWHRAVVTRLHEECRRLVLSLTQSQLKALSAPSLGAPLPGESPSGESWPTGTDARGAEERRFPPSLRVPPGSSPAAVG